jgi:hypothetical protein
MESDRFRELEDGRCRSSRRRSTRSEKFCSTGSERLRPLATYRARGCGCAAAGVYELRSAAATLLELESARARRCHCPSSAGSRVARRDVCDADPAERRRPPRRDRGHFLNGGRPVAFQCREARAAYEHARKAAGGWSELAAHDRDLLQGLSALYTRVLTRCKGRGRLRGSPAPARDLGGSRRVRDAMRLRFRP